MSVTQSFANKNSAGLAFTNISAVETDTGSIAPLLSLSAPPIEQTETVGAYQALDFNGFSAAVLAPGSALNVVFTYDVASTVAGQGISALQQSFTPDVDLGAVSLVITENVYNQSGVLVGTTSTNLSQVNDPTNGTYAFGDMVLSGSYSNLHVVVTVAASIAPTGSVADIIAFSDLEQGFSTSALSATPQPGTLTGHVFNDTSADGVQETGEGNLSGISVQLLDSNGNVIVGATTTTDANGNYSFTGLNPGNYAVVFTAPNGDKFSPVGTSGNAAANSIVAPNGQTSEVAVTAGGTTANQNAGLYVPGTIVAHVYNDNNKNGTQDTGDTNLSGLTVQLLNSSGAVVATTTTDANGNVSFAGLVPGNYDISIVTPTGETVTQASNVGTMLTVGAGQTVTATEGLFNPGALSGHVFLDANANGVQDAGDTNVSGVTVSLYTSSGVNTGLTAVTDVNGAYSFTGLVAGTYIVAVGAPTGDKFDGVVGTNSNAAVDSIVNFAGMVATTVTAGSTTTNQNAGVYAPATFTAHVYTDANKDGSQDNGETNLSGVTVNLLTGAGVATGVTAITDANGNVSFAGLTPGSYEVSVATPTGDTVTQASNVGTPITLASGGTASAVEGLFNPGALSGHIFLDANDNGVQDTGDTNLSGVTVTLLNSSGASTGVTAITDANGAYTFGGLVAGTYSVAFTAPTGDKFDTVTGTNSNAALDSLVSALGKTSPVSVVAGATTANQNAGVFLPATFTAHVYTDANKDGSQDNGETNLSGVTVNLLTGAGVATGVTAITDANGNVSFAGLTPGSYEVSVNTPTGDTVTQASNVGTPITLASGSTVSAIEGVFNPAALSGHVFLDANANGVQDTGDANISGVTVSLYTGGGVNTGLTAVTDVNGAYSFTGLVAGTYIVVVGAPTGDKFDAVVGTNSNAAVDSIVNSAGMVATTVTAGSTTTNQNAGVYAPATFTTHVYTDTNKDGSQDNGEANLSGVTVNLLTGAGVATGVTAITDANGNVSFAGLTPGSYEVSVATPTGDTVTQASNVGTPITLASGGTAAAVEGLFNPGALSGHIFLDANDNGVQDTGDTNLSGVTVTLLNSSGASTGVTAITDANGFYSFGGLVAGTYSVAFTGPTGDKFDTVTGTNSNAALDSLVSSLGKTSPVSVVAGATTANQNAGVFLPATFTAHVYTDANKDGSQDNGETNLSGVTVNLLTGAGVATGVTAITDANGNVSFAGLTPGSYEVSVATPAGDTVTQASNVGTPITLVSGGTASAVEGVFNPGALSGHIFLDANDNGVQDTGDTNLSGVTVTLLNSSGASTGVTATTDANGAYTFGGLVAGTYSVAFTAPTGDTFDTVTGTNSNAAVDSIVSSLGKTSPVSVVAGATTANQNAGVFLPATFTTHVYTDTNKDGSQDNGEANLSGVTVNLLTGAGVATGVTAVTDSNGNVSFAGLTPGSYEVSVNTPTGDTVTQASNVGTPITLVSGGTASAVEGLVGIGSLSGRVFYDYNDNGVFNASTATGTNLVVDGSFASPGTGGGYGVFCNGSVQGWTSNNNEIEIGTTTLYGQAATYGSQNAELNGNTFDTITQTITGLVVGQSYTLSWAYGGRSGSGNEQMNTLFNGVQVGVNTSNGVSNLGWVYNSVTVVATSTTETLSFAAINVGGSATIGNELDGVSLVAASASSDYALAGQTVTLLTGSGVSTGQTAITDVNGNYSFTGLASGTYEVSVAAAPGDRFDTVVGTNANPALNSIVNTNGLSPVETVTAGNNTPNVNAGEFAPSTFTTHVYLDANKDGVQDNGEGNLSGVTVNLLTGAGVATGTTGVTDANGNVSFTGLNPGSYEVSVTTPAGDTVTQATNIGAANTLLAGQTAYAVEGLSATGALSGRVFGDYNADGVFDAGMGTDFGLSGQTVQLLNSSGAAIAGITAITDSNGNYTFSNLAPGKYEVQVVMAPGAKFSQVGTNSNAALDSVVNSQGVSPLETVVAGATTANVNAAEYTPATFNAHVYLDANKNSTQDSGEANLSGVTVNLLTGTGAATGLTAVTDANGNVSFAGLAPGSYEVAVVTPTGDTVTQATNVSTPVTLTVGSTTTAVEGLYVPKPSITIVKTPSVTTTTPGVGTPPLTYTFTVTNTGTTALTGVSVTDITNGNPATAVTYTDPNTLAAGATWVYKTPAVTVGETQYTTPVLGSGHGFNLGDVLTYGIIAFHPGTFTEASCSPVVGNVGVGSYSALNVTGGGIAGDLETTGALPGHTSNTYWNYSTWSWATTTTGCATTCTSSTSGTDTSYGSIGWSANWGSESSGGSNCYSNFGCSGSTGSAVWDEFWSQCTTAKVSTGVSTACSTDTTAQLTLNVSEDAWQGNAQFTVMVDGKQVGGTYTATACHGSGQSQAFNLGAFSVGTHTVTVNFLNDAYGGTASTDRNLYVNSITQNGTSICGATQASSGAVNYTIDSGSVGGDDSDDSWGNFFNSCSSSTYNSSYSGGAYGQIANSTTLSADITALATLSSQLFAESGTSVSLCSGTNLAATSGKMDASGNEVFNVTGWSNNFTVTGDGTHSVVLNVASGVTVNLGQLSLQGGISANQVMINYTGTSTITDCGGTTNATILAPNAAFNLQNGTINGHVLGGASGQAFTIGSGATVEAPPLTSYNLTDTATATGTSGGTTVTANSSASVVVNPTNSGVSQNCNAPSSCDNLWNDYGQVQKLEFCFNPSTTVNTNAGSCGISAGSCNTSASNPCFITITDSASDSLSGCNTYFEGSVTAGQKIFADSSSLWNGAAGAGCFSTTSGAMLYAHVFSSQAACQAGQSATQEVAYDTSGAHSISLGDQVGCLSVVGYVSTSGHGYTV